MTVGGTDMGDCNESEQVYQYQVVYSFIAYGSSKNWIEHYKIKPIHDNHIISITS